MQPSPCPTSTFSILKAIQNNPETTPANIIEGSAKDKMTFLELNTFYLMSGFYIRLLHVAENIKL